MPRILIAYATRTGSTREIADFVAGVIRDEGINVDIKEVREVRHLTGYNGVILGTAIRAGKPMTEVVPFLKRHTKDFETLPVAYYMVCLTLKDDTPEAKETVQTYLAPLRAVHKPVAEGQFAGSFTLARMSGFLGFFFKRLKESPIPEGDWRDWDAIKAWTLATLPKLLIPQAIHA